MVWLEKWIEYLWNRLELLMGTLPQNDFKGTLTAELVGGLW